MKAEILPDHAVFAIARSDDYFFGVLHSRVHELWARAQGTQLREVESGFRYTPTSTFETFPFPWPPGKEPQDSPLVEAIAEAARGLVRQRDNWLNPPDAAPEALAKLTLTNLYNKRPTWLENAHRKLDEAVFAAYGWPATLTDAELLERLLALNRERADSQQK
jgi:type II restriction/modification system DNA methylase subunit YeeA